MVEPRGTGMALFTLRATEEVRAAQFPAADGDLDPEMVAIAGAIIKQRTGTFDPSEYRDRYQTALRELIEAKMKGRSVKPRQMTPPPPVIDLMAALKRSLAQEAPAANRAAQASTRAKRDAPVRRQSSLLLPVSGGHRQREEASAQAATIDARRQKRA